jgi:hypothetical protein
LEKQLEAKTVERVTVGYIYENVREMQKKDKTGSVTTQKSRKYCDSNCRVLRELEKSTSSEGEWKWPTAGIVAERPFPRGFDHIDTHTRATDAMINIVGALTPGCAHTEFVPLDTFIHCDADDTRWADWEAATEERGRLSGGPMGLLGGTVFSSHRPHCQAASPYGMPVVKIFALYRLCKTPFFDPEEDKARFTGRPYVLQEEPDPPPKKG